MFEMTGNYDSRIGNIRVQTGHSPSPQGCPRLTTFDVQIQSDLRPSLYTSANSPQYVYQLPRRLSNKWRYHLETRFAGMRHRQSRRGRCRSTTKRIRTKTSTNDTELTQPRYEREKRREGAHGVITGLKNRAS